MKDLFPLMKYYRVLDPSAGLCPKKQKNLKKFFFSTNSIDFNKNIVDYNVFQLGIF